LRLLLLPPSLLFAQAKYNSPPTNSAFIENQIAAKKQIACWVLSFPIRSVKKQKAKSRTVVGDGKMMNSSPTPVPFVEKSTKRSNQKSNNKNKAAKAGYL